MLDFGHGKSELHEPAAGFAGPMGSAGRANATYTHTGDRVMFLGGNKPADAFDTLDLGLQFAEGNWTLAAGLANVTNEKGVLSITDRKSVV